jgi:hypothetical protein
MKTILFLLLTASCLAEDTIPVFSLNKAKNKIRTTMWIDSISYRLNLAKGVNRDSLLRDFTDKRKYNLAQLKKVK